MRMKSVLLLLSIVEDDTERIAASRPHPTHSVSKIDSVVAAFPLERTVIHRKRDRISLVERHDLNTRLHARSLLGENKFSSGEIPSRLRKENRHLYGKHMLAIEILMEAVVVTGSVLQKQRRGFGLTSFVASCKELRVFLRIPHINPEKFVPSVGNWFQMRV